MKEHNIKLGIEKIQEILGELNPNKKWTIVYEKALNFKLCNKWDVEYHGLLENEEYILIYDDEHLLYTINVTGDSVLCALNELMSLLVNKF